MSSSVPQDLQALQSPTLFHWLVQGGVEDNCMGTNPGVMLMHETVLPVVIAINYTYDRQVNVHCRICSQT